MRPTLKPQVTAIPKIRSHFCFDFVDGNKLRVRRLSCHCDHCLAREWRKCRTKCAGPWKSLTLEKKAGIGLSSASSLSSVRKKVSKKRRKLASACKVDEIVALEAKDDEEGFSFWLAKTSSPGNAWTYEGPSKTEKGVKFIQGHQYITIKLLERFPPSNPHKQEEEL